jgi:hypothetical protein
VATDPALDVALQPLGGEARPLEEWLTTFPLAMVVLDPYTYESSWILETARRILTTYKGAGVRPCWLVCAPEEQAASFLGPLADELLVFADPDRALVSSLGLERLPAFVLIRQDGHVAAAAESWTPEAWRDVTEALFRLTRWPRPTIPAAGDPLPYEGTPALG